MPPASAPSAASLPPPPPPPPHTLPRRAVTLPAAPAPYPFPALVQPPHPLRSGAPGSVPPLTTSLPAPLIHAPGPPAFSAVLAAGQPEAHQDAPAPVSVPSPVPGMSAGLADCRGAGMHVPPPALTWPGLNLVPPHLGHASLGATASVADLHPASSRPSLLPAQGAAAAAAAAATLYQGGGARHDGSIGPFGPVTGPFVSGCPPPHGTHPAGKPLHYSYGPHAPLLPPGARPSTGSLVGARLNWCDMICQTLAEVPGARLVVQDLFVRMCASFPEIREWAIGKNWEGKVKNRIKSTLSIKTHMFEKIARPPSVPGKGAWWALRPDVLAEWIPGHDGTGTRKLAVAVRSLPGQPQHRTVASGSLRPKSTGSRRGSGGGAGGGTSRTGADDKSARLLPPNDGSSAQAGGHSSATTRRLRPARSMPNIADGTTSPASGAAPSTRPQPYPSPSWQPRASEPGVSGGPAPSDLTSGLGPPSAALPAPALQFIMSPMTSTLGWPSLGRPYGAVGGQMDLSSAAGMPDGADVFMFSRAAAQGSAPKAQAAHDHGVQSPSASGSSAGAMVVPEPADMMLQRWMTQSPSMATTVSPLLGMGSSSPHGLLAGHVGGAGLAPAPLACYPSSPASLLSTPGLVLGADLDSTTTGTASSSSAAPVFSLDADAADPLSASPSASPSSPSSSSLTTTPIVRARLEPPPLSTPSFMSRAGLLDPAASSSAAALDLDMELSFGGSSAGSAGAGDWARFDTTPGREAADASTCAGVELVRTSGQPMEPPAQEEGLLASPARDGGLHDESGRRRNSNSQ